MERLHTSLTFGMGKFYISAVAIFFLGMAVYWYGSVESKAAVASILVFVGATLIMTGAASFILVFGYHVRATAGSLASSKNSERL